VEIFAVLLDDDCHNARKSLASPTSSSTKSSAKTAVPPDNPNGCILGFFWNDSSVGIGMEQLTHAFSDHAARYTFLLLFDRYPTDSSTLGESS
jgi:hypothetical protein